MTLAGRQDVLSWISLTEREMLSMRDGKGLISQMFKIRQGFSHLLRKRKIDRQRYGELVGLAERVMVEYESKKFGRARKRRSGKVVLDLDESLIIYSRCSRKEGERHLQEERDRQKLEEAYVFIRYLQKSGRTSSVWIEVGNREKEDQAVISLYQLAAILKRYSRITEASLYHYHPGKEDQARNESRISVPDLLMSAQYEAKVGRLLKVPMDFRVVNFDGIYAYSGVTFDLLADFTNTDLFRVNMLSGKRLIRLLRDRGISCSFRALPRK